MTSAAIRSPRRPAAGIRGLVGRRDPLEQARPLLRARREPALRMKAPEPAFEERMAHTAASRMVVSVIVWLCSSQRPDAWGEISP